MNKRQLAFLILLIYPVYKINLLPSYFVSICGQDSYIAVAIVGLVDLLTLPFIMYVVDRGGLKRVVSRPIYIGIAVICVVWFTLRLGAVNSDIVHYVSKVLFEHDRRTLILIMSLATAVYLAIGGDKGIGRLADIGLYFFVGWLVLFVLFNKAHIDVGEVTPILDNGISWLPQAFRTSIAFGDFLPLLFIKVRDDKKSDVPVYLGAIGAYLVVVATYFIFVCEYGLIAPDIDSAFKSMMNQVAITIESGRLEWLGMAVWIGCNTIYIAYVLVAEHSAISGVFRSNNNIWYIIICTLGIFVINEYIFPTVVDAFVFGESIGWVALGISVIIPILSALCGMIGGRRYETTQQIER